MKKVVIIDDFLDNPEEIVAMVGKEIELRPPDESELKSWEGLRSDNLLEINEEVFAPILFKAIHAYLGEDSNVQFGAEMHFHLHVTGDDEDSYPWQNYRIHRDKNASIAGVLYLTKNPEPNTGTEMTDWDVTRTELMCEAKYNRIILFAGGEVPHGPVGVQGSSLEDGRLVIIFFINDMRPE